MSRKICALGLALLLALSFFVSVTPAEAAEQLGTWQYRYGDPSLKKAGPQEWVQSALDGDSVWQSFAFPYLPWQKGQNYVWVTTLIHDYQGQDDSLYFMTYHEAVQVWLNDTLIYTYGDMGPRYFGYGWRWHIVPLPAFAGQARLTFRIYSDLPFYLEPVHDFRLGSDRYVMEHVFLSDALYVATLPLILFMLFLLAVYYINGSQDKPIYRDTAVFLGLLGLLICCASSTRQLLADWPVFWLHLSLVLLFLLPLSLNRVAYDVLEPEYRPTVRHILRAYEVLLAVALLAEVLNGCGLDYGLFSLLVLLVVAQGSLILLLWRSARQYNNYSASLRWTVLGMLLLTLLDGLNVSQQWVPSNFSLLPLCVFPLTYFLFTLMRNRLQRERQLAVDALVLEAEEAQAVERSELDELTGCLNRSAYDQIMAHVVHDSQAAFCLIMLDIYHFKQINDTYGHATGDKVLRQVTDDVRMHLHHQMKFFRWGGEEFVVYCPDMSLMEAAGFADLLRQSIAQRSILPERPVTVSVGVARWHGYGDRLTRIFNRMDSALYRAKAQGRNQVLVEQERG